MRLLVIDDDKIVLTHLKIYADRIGLEFFGAESLEVASSLLEKEFFDLVLVDANLNGRKVLDSDLRLVSKKCNRLAVISADFDEIPGWEFLQKPFSLEQFQAFIFNLKKG